MQEQLNLTQKLAKIRSISDVVAKERRGYNYSYADITTILAKITAGMKKYGVSLVPEIVPNSAEVTKNVITNTKTDKTGKTFENTTTEMLVTAEMAFTWINDDNPSETMVVPWFLTGSQSDPSQAFGSGLTYCIRYFLTSFFQIAQPEKDVDAYRSKQKAAEESEQKAMAEEIISRFDTVLKQYLAGNPERVEDVQKFISKYAKNSNYFGIKNPELAAKLFEDFKNHYFEESNNK